MDLCALDMHMLKTNKIKPSELDSLHIRSSKTGGAQVCVLLVLELQFPKLFLLVQILRHLVARPWVAFWIHKPVLVQMTSETVMIGSDHAADHTGFVNVRNGDVLVSNLYAHAVDLAGGVCGGPDGLLQLQWTTSASRRQFMVLEAAFAIKVQAHSAGARATYVLSKISKKNIFEICGQQFKSCVPCGHAVPVVARFEAIRSAERLEFAFTMECWLVPQNPPADIARPLDEQCHYVFQTRQTQRPVV
jgi:hypothetical protein